jgi:leader peptidase (prepilin peptidase)/N-methyltransferase
LNAPPEVIALCSAAGLIAGQVLSLVAVRLPRRMHWDLENEVALAQAELGREGQAPAGPRPALFARGPECEHCGAALRGVGVVPVLGYLIRNARCVACGVSLPLMGPLVELTLAVVFGALVAQNGLGIGLLAAAVLAALLVTLAAIDARERLLPDALTLPGLWIGLTLNAFSVTVDPTSAILGAAGGWLFMAGSQWLFSRITGREGVAAGDHKLVAMMGAWLGWQVLPAILLLAMGTAALTLVLGRLGAGTTAQAGETAQAEMPFGPHLAAGGLLIMLGGTSWFSALVL